jgi:hypothetical protein
LAQRMNADSSGLGLNLNGVEQAELAGHRP